MLFKDNKELQAEVFKLLNDKFGKYSSVTGAFVIKEDEITFRGDCYFDPILVLRMIRDHNIITGHCTYAGSEEDRMHIKGCDNIDMLRKLLEKDVSHNNFDTLIKELGDSREIKRRVHGNITIEEEDKLYFIPENDWQKYWELRGQPEGPKSGWELPTAGEIFATLRNNKSVLFQPAKPSLTANDAHPVSNPEERMALGK